MRSGTGKAELLQRGHEHVHEFCVRNGLETPLVIVRPRSEWFVGACAFYRPIRIEICLEACASIGTAGMAWSFPGYSVDRTPFGVLAHEIGHHADVVLSTRKARYFGDFSIDFRRERNEERLTSYCPNDAEWFAEMFRLFVTNPDLLRVIRPRTYEGLRERYAPVELRSWEEVLQDAPERTLAACRKKVLDETVKRARQLKLKGEGT